MISGTWNIAIEPRAQRRAHADKNCTPCPPLFSGALFAQAGRRSQCIDE
jgi:hypothetical protein